MDRQLSVLSIASWILILEEKALRLIFEGLSVLLFILFNPEWPPHAAIKRYGNSRYE